MNHLLIDGNESSLFELVYPSMSLSSSRANMNRHDFQIFLEKPLLIHDFSAKYERLVEELKCDEKKQGWIDSDDVIAQARYPSLNLVLKDESMTEMVFGCYLIEDLFNTYCCTDHTNIKYWYDELINLAILENGVTLNGICYSKKN